MARVSIAVMLALLLASSTSAQVIVSQAPHVQLTSRDTRAVTVAAGSTTTVPLVVDPSAAGGDLVDVITADPAIVIFLILPGGVEINAGSAAALGATYTVLPDGSSDELESVSPFSAPGTHTLITLGASSPSGTYHVKANASTVTVDTALIASYLSTSAVRAGLLTESPLYRIGDTVVLSGVVFEGSAPVTQASASVAIGDPSDTVAPAVQVTLQDSGTFDDRTGDGIYTGEFTATAAGSFSAALRVTGFSSAGVPFSRTAATTFKVLPLLAVIDSFSDAGVDDNANELIDRVVITANTTVHTAGRYQFGLTLEAANGAEMKASTIAVLEAGPAPIPVSFAAEGIRRLGVGGPYVLKNVILTYQDDHETQIVDFREKAGNTAAYLPSSLEEGPLFAAGLNAPPVIDPVRDVVADATSTEGAKVTFNLPFARDAVDRAPNVSAKPASGTVFALGTTTVTVTATNASGNSSTATFTVTVRSTAPPVVTVPANMTLEATSPNGAVATFTATASDIVDGTDPVTCAPASGSTFPLLPLGTLTTVTCVSSNTAGRTATKTFTVTVRDTTPPAITCGAADSSWHGSDVTIACTAEDVGSGLTAPGDAAFVLSTAVPANSETSNASTTTRPVCDKAGTCATAGPIGGNRVDKKGPQISLLSPASSPYTVNQIVAASYACTDAGAPLTTCTGSRANGENIDTASPGTHNFLVTSADAVGNSSTVSRNYDVSYGGVLTTISPQVWLGLKNSDDVGTRFDLLVEILENGTVVAVGELDGVAGGSSGFNNAILRAIGVAPAAPVTYLPGDTLGVRLSVRIAASGGGHRSGIARLWFNDAAASSQAGATVSGVARALYLADGFALTMAPGAGPKKNVDVFVDRLVDGNPFKPFGTWSITF